ncbi:hypothetical protein CVIRNUC_009150 [Coccomyxa viridis]|uniref:Swiss Army Knife 2H phosphoesterase domain-containing protein n=1 Tax=Coccomyxa viridis TaxID=1274662 RepID=A0AAV1IIA0_9CHLO|nr:hypothetical protein CVIRNUC_009150 [Coccomyxa viridis]
MASSSVLVCVLLALALAAVANASFTDSLFNTTKQVVDGVLNKGEKQDPRDVNDICHDVNYPPGFPRVPGQFSISSTVFNSSQIAFSPKPNYVQQTLDFSAVLPLFNAVNTYSTAQGVPLQNRGESHITVITPPEFANMQPYITIDQLNSLAADTIQKSEFCIVCLGRDTLNLPVGAATQALDTVYNAVVRAPDIVAYRQKVQDMFISAGGDGSHFDASHAFGPHITLGFTAASATKGLFAPTDLFIEQDIFKFEQSCVAPITLT